MNRPSENAGTSPTRNERLVREYFAAVWNEGDIGTFDTEVVSNGYLLHHGTDVTYTVENLRTAWTDWHAAFPDARNEIEDVIAADDKVVVRYRFSGTHESEIMGVPATGRAVETAGIVIFRIENNRLVEAWAVDDVYGLLERLGALPAAS